MDKVLLEGRSQRSVSLDYSLPNQGMLPNCLAQYRKTGILLLRKQEGDQLKWDVNGRNDRTRATSGEEWTLTDWGGLPKKVERVREMVSGGFRLDLLLEIARLARSTYYYQLKQLDGVDKDKEIKTVCTRFYRSLFLNWKTQLGNNIGTWSWLFHVIVLYWSWMTPH